MINISSHGLTPGELLTRRLSSAPVPHRAAGTDLGAFGTSIPLASGQEIMPAGQRYGAPKVLVAGAAGEIRTLGDGRRQILRLRLPGDVLYDCDREAVVALSRTRVTDARPFLERLDQADAPPGLRRAWLSLAEAEQNLLRDHLVRLGRMTAAERLGHLLLEIHQRLSLVALVDGETFHLPATQETISDLLGLSIVHLSRTLQTLRRGGLVALRHGALTILDRRALEALCGWSLDSRAPLPAAMPQPIAVNA